MEQNNIPTFPHQKQMEEIWAKLKKDLLFLYMKKLLLIIVVLGAFFIFLYGCQESEKPNLEESIFYTQLSESDILNHHDADVKKHLRKLIATGKCITCTFAGATLTGKDLKGKILTSSNLTLASSGVLTP